MYIYFFFLRYKLPLYIIIITINPTYIFILFIYKKYELNIKIEKNI